MFIVVRLDSDEPWVQHIISFNVSGRNARFRTRIRARDRSVISGIMNAKAPYGWSIFQAAHIFSLEGGNLWIEWGFG